MEPFYYYLKRLHSYSGKILYFNILGMGIISFIEGMSIFLLIPLISLSGIADMGESEILQSYNIGNLIPFSGKLSLALVLSFYCLLIVGQNLVDRNLAVRNMKIIQGFIGQLRENVYKDLMHANWNFYTRKRKSDIINIMTTELARVAGGIYQFIHFLSSLIFTFTQIGFAFYLSSRMTLFVLLSGFTLSLFSRKFIKQSKKIGNKTSALAQEYLAGITDQMNGIKEIKSNTLEESRLKWLHSLVKGMYDEQIEYIQLKTASQFFYKITSTGIIAVSIYLSVNMFDAQPGQFLLIIVIFSRLWPRITAIQASLEQIASTLPAFKQLLNMQIECRKANEISQNAYHTNIKPLKIDNVIECQNVSFTYDSKGYALKNIDLKIESYMMTAIVGASGAGKSTLIDILMGLNQPQMGKVLIDGNLLTGEILMSLRKSISYVPQDPFLFNASIRENLQLMKQNASEEELWEALEFSAAADFVKMLPNGLDTMIGDRGIRLSGGERQRLVLARAILRNPSILVLDEATSALDSENEAKIQKAIEKLKGKMTIIVIAHRLSTIQNADQVIVLDKGRIIQKGGFSELAKDNHGMFNNLLDKQMKAVM